MSTWINEGPAKVYQENGVLLGKSEPSAETKGTWWQVYYLDGNIGACVMYGWGVSCGEEITDGELKGYVDDLETATLRLEECRRSHLSVAIE